jgi:hypothetical protein
MHQHQARQRQLLPELRSRKAVTRAATGFGFRVLWCNRFGQSPERIPERPDGEIPDLSSRPEILL